MGSVGFGSHRYDIVPAEGHPPDGSLFFATAEDAELFLISILHGERGRAELLRILEHPGFANKHDTKELAHELAPSFAGRNPRYRFERVDSSASQISTLPEAAASAAAAPPPKTNDAAKIRIQISVDKASVTRGESVKFSAKILEGSPGSMEWEIVPQASPGIEGAKTVTATGATFSCALLGPVKATLSSPGAEVTPAELSVAVRPRSGFKIEYHPMTGKTSSNFGDPVALQMRGVAPTSLGLDASKGAIFAGRCACAEGSPEECDDARHAIHRVKDKTANRETGENYPHPLRVWKGLNYKVAAIEGAGPFAGLHYVASCSLRIKRRILYEKRLLDRGSIQEANKAHHNLGPFEKFRMSVEDHERGHDDAIGAALDPKSPHRKFFDEGVGPRLDSVKPAEAPLDLEAMAAPDEAALCEKADHRLSAAEDILWAALSDHTYIEAYLKSLGKHYDEMVSIWLSQDAPPLKGKMSTLGAD